MDGPMTGKLKISGLAVLFLTAAVLGVPLAGDETAFERSLERQFNYPPPEPQPKEVADMGEGQVRDAEYFSKFPEFDKSYSPKTRSQAQQLAAKLRLEARGLTHEAFVLRVAEIAALAGNAHTSVGENAFRKNTPRLPVRLYPFSDGLFVLYAKPELSDLLGARIDAIDGTPVDQIFARLAKFRSGIEAYRRRQLIPVLESPALLYAAGLSTSRASLLLTGINTAGQRFERRVEAEQRDRSAWVSQTARLLYPEGLKDTGMVSFLKKSPSEPVYLHSVEKLFWLESLPLRGFYIGMAHNGNADEEPMQAFLARAKAALERERPGYVVLDMRMNGGGDYTTTYAFARALPALQPDGNIYVLTSPWTFSAAITTVAALKQAGGERVKIVGEPVGDRLDFWAEGNSFALPNAFLLVHYSTGRHIYDGPCTDRATCYWLNERYPVRVKTLAPGIHAPLSFQHYRAGRDPAMEAILQYERPMP